MQSFLTPPPSGSRLSSLWNDEKLWNILSASTEALIKKEADAADPQADAILSTPFQGYGVSAKQGLSSHMVNTQDVSTSEICGTRI
jgi:hypothetical protein